MAHLHEWIVRLDAVRPLSSLPRVGIVAQEMVDDSSYYHPGTGRQDQQICFQYTLEGEGCFRDRQGEHRVPADHGFLCRVSDDEIAYYYPPEARLPWRFVYIALFGDVAHSLWRELVGRQGPVFSVPRQSLIIQRLLAFERETQQQAWPAFDLAALAFQLFQALHESAHGEGSDVHQHLVRRAMKLAHDERRNQLTVTDLAARLQVSREHLSRTFQRELGVTLHTYIQRQRMRLACDLLKQTNWRVKEIAAELHYPDTARFSRAFQQVLGMSPTDFRSRGIYPAI